MNNYSKIRKDVLILKGLKSRKQTLLPAVVLIILLILTLNFGCGGGERSSHDPDPTSIPVGFGTITGTVLNEEGIPEKDIDVYWGFYETDRSRGYSTVTDVNGRYRFDNVPAGRHIITAVGSNNKVASTEVNVNDYQTVEAPAVRIEPTGTIQGSALYSLTETPLADVTVKVNITGWNNLNISTSTDTTGGFILPYIAAGTHTLSAEKTGYITETCQIYVAAGETTFQNFHMMLQTDPTPTPTPTQSPTPTPTYSPTPGVKEWTFLVYIAADNNLEGEGVSDINEMEQVGSTDQVNIVVQYDRNGNYYPNLDWIGCRRYYITRNNNPGQIGSELIEDLGIVDTGDPAALVDFATWGIQNYPAHRYALIIWDHGTGWRLVDEDFNTKGICCDDTSGNHISQPQLRTALQQIRAYYGKNLELIGMDACLMGNLEVAYDVIDIADYLVFSEAAVPAAGYPYHTILQDLTSNPTQDGAALGTSIVNRYGDNYASYTTYTMSALKMSEINSLLVALDDFVSTARSLMGTERLNFIAARVNSASISYSYSDYKDLWLYMETLRAQTSNNTVKTKTAAVQNAVNNAVIARVQGAGAGVRDSKGISIWLPDPNQYNSYISRYLELAFASRTWDEFLADVMQE